MIQIGEYEIQQLENFINNYEKRIYKRDTVFAENVGFVTGFKACLGRIKLAEQGYREYLGR